MSDITLTAAVRSNLSTLQSTSNLISQTQERLSTGYKVNSALDNPNSFFTAESLNNRAGDLSNLQDDIGQGVSTLEAADKGISAISELVDAAKAKANQALQTDDAKERATYEKQFNELRTQITDLAKDSGYKGKNLLAGTGNDLEVKFNEDGSSNLNISAVDYTDLENGDMKISGLTESDKGSSASLTLTGATDGSTTLESLAAFEATDTLEIDVNGTKATLTISSETTVDDLVGFLDDNLDSTVTYDGTTGISVEEGYENFSFTYTNNGGGGADGAGVADKSVSDATSGSFQTDAGIEAAIGELNSANSTLRAQASTFGTNLSIVENRQDFTSEMIKTLEVGAGKLTLADMNKEGANLSALQTQQQLATSTLSLAAQASQSVLQLIR
ncbi:flagellin [Pseudovibrio exalbescens]|uniref:flagellin n=1 Tax=Pseudovibrio exalbescens TaxID=197461 RepID=UPI002365787F|nr:flagellin [Pseudovibrio exalbescens]MDD7910428.1 flagellin [Pseudovibrio exalbescens]